MLSISHPEFVYRPLSGEQRKKLSDAQLTRLGIPLGFRRIYGQIVSEEIAQIVRKMLAIIAHQQGRRTAESVAAKFATMTPSAARRMVAEFSALRLAIMQTRRDLKKEQTKERTKDRERVRRKLLRETAIREARPSRPRTVDIEEMENAMLLFDEGLSADQISKALHLPRTKIQEQIRATKRGS